MKRISFTLTLIMMGLLSVSCASTNEVEVKTNNNVRAEAGFPIMKAFEGPRT